MELNIRSLKKISISFIVANLFDVISTVLALVLGGTEINPIVVDYGWGVGTVPKFLVTIVAVLYLEISTTWWFSWLLPIVVWLIVVWNIFNIILMVLI